MRTFSPLSKLSMLLLGLLAASAMAQGPGGYFPAANVPGAGFPGTFGDVDPGNSAQSFTTAIDPSFPGRLWFSYTGASEGVGFDTGGFFTLGGKTRLGTDLLDGRWLLEGRGHLAHEQGGVFGNLGIERIFTITPAKTDIGFNFFVDGDGDRARSFGHTFWGLGVGGFLRHEKFEVRGNGYIPIGTTAYRLGDPQNCFFGHNILLQHGLDSAMEGFDLEVTIRPWKWQMLQGHLDVGGYYYRDADESLTEIESFAGVRVRGRVTTLRGVSVEAEYNYDERFKGTLIGRLVISSAIFGQYSRLGQDLDVTRRNDHIVRVHQDVILAVDPDTGSPYIVRHVDNSAPAGGDGTAERPFDELADVDPTQAPVTGAAAGASSPDDIIFVREGDGTVMGYNTGIVLQNRQMLLGDGVEHFIPLAGGGSYRLCNDVDGNKPRISAADGATIVTLADANTVAGLTIDGRDPAAIGIRGDGIAGGVTIRDNMFMNLAEDGVQINTISGDITVSRNMFLNIGDDAVEINDIISAFGTHTFDSNIIGSLIAAAPIDDEPAGQPGIPIEFVGQNVPETSIDDVGILIDGFVGENTFVFRRNTIMNTGTQTAVGGNGISLLNGTNAVAGVGGTVLFDRNVISQTGGHGIEVSRVADVEAAFAFTSNMVTNADQDGIHMEDFDGRTFFFNANTTSANVCNGVLLDNYVGLGGDFDFRSHVADENSDYGISIDTADGDFLFLDSQIGDVNQADMVVTGNEGGGIKLFNVTNTVKGTRVLIDRSSAFASSNIIGNGEGAGAGVKIELEGDLPLANPLAAYTTFATITNSTIDLNGIGIKAVARSIDAVRAVPTNLDLNIINNLSISNNRKDGIVAEALRGGSIDMIVTSTMSDGMGGIAPQQINGNGSETGVALRLLAYDEGTNRLTTLNALVSNNTMTGTGGDAIGAVVFAAAGGAPRDFPNFLSPFAPPGIGRPASIPGNANMNLRFDNNTLQGTGGDTMHFEYDINNNLVNTLVIDDNRLNVLQDGTIVGNAADGINISSTATTRLDLFIRDNLIEDPDAIGGPGGRGIALELLDTTLTRASILDNTLNDDDDNTRQGILAFTADEARLVANISGNNVNGFGFAGAARSVVGNVTDGVDFSLLNDFLSGGIDVVAINNSNIAVRIEDNHVQDSAMQGIGIFAGAMPTVDLGRVGTEIGIPVASSANIDAVVLNNDLLANDQTSASDTTVAGFTAPPVVLKSANRFEFRAESNGDNSSLCLALNHNFGSVDSGSEGSVWLIREEEGLVIFEDGINTPEPESFSEPLPPLNRATAAGLGLPTGLPAAPPTIIRTFNEVESTATGCIFNFNSEALLFEAAFGFPPIP